VKENDNYYDRGNNSNYSISTFDEEQIAMKGMMIDAISGYQRMINDKIKMDNDSTNELLHDDR
jgi:hypothetical protein